MRNPTIFVLLPVLALLGCQSGSNPGGGGPNGGGGSVLVKAAQGGTVQSGSAKLVIPPGALSQDSAVRLALADARQQTPGDPLQPAGPSVQVDLGGATLSQPASLSAPFTPGAQPAYYVVLETGAGEDPDGGTETWVRPIVDLSNEAVIPPGVQLPVSVTRSATYEVVLLQPAPTEGGDTSLQVPFYGQFGYPWCAPTSMSMLIDFFEPLPGLDSRPDAPGGRVSNYFLTTFNRQSPGDGANVADSVQLPGVPQELWQFRRWDPNLMPSAPFTAFAIEVTTGFFGAFPARPFVAASDRQWHAFVITGANGNGVFINNSNDTWSGTHPFMTWADFKTWTCKLADKDDPSKGCSTEDNQDLATLNILGQPRPETERRGSISLWPDSLKFYDSFNHLLSTSSWSGFYGGGYAFSDQDGFGRIPYDATYNHAIPSSALLLTQFFVVNTSSVDADYELSTQLTVDGVAPTTHTETDTISALSQAAVTPYNGVFRLDDLVAGGIHGPTEATLDIVLRQAGVVQDEKHVKLKVVPPTMVPAVSITAPSAALPIYRGVPVQLAGFAKEQNPSTGQLDLDVPCGHMFWRSSDTSDDTPSFCSGMVTFTTNGSRTLTLTAVGYQSATSAATVTVTVTDPPPNLPPVIDEMHIRDSNGNEILDGQAVATKYPLSLSVKAHDPDNDPIAYGWSACMPSWTPLQCGMNGGLPTGTDGSSSFDPLQHGYGTWTFYVTADDGKHDLATIQSRTITIDQDIR